MAELLKIENVSVYGNMPVLKLTPNGTNCLNGKETLLISFLDALTDNDIQEFNESEQALFLKLKTLRRTYAEENDLPAFIICSDQVLREICFKKPTDRQSLLAVKGIGEKFTAKYGSAFIKSIETHLQQ